MNTNGIDLRYKTESWDFEPASDVAEKWSKKDDKDLEVAWKGADNKQ